MTMMEVQIQPNNLAMTQCLKDVNFKVKIKEINSIIDQSQVFIDKYNDNYKKSDVDTIKKRIEAMSTDNPFVYATNQSDY